MTILDINGQEIEFDKDGFLLDHVSWNEEVAKIIGASEGIKILTDEHWKVIYYLRNYYKRFNVAPMVSTLCKGTCCRLDCIYKLFPSGPSKGVCKIAGLPKPSGCM